MKNATKNNFILSSLIAASLISFSSCKLSDVKVVSAPEEVIYYNAYDYDEVSKFIVLHCYNKFYNEDELFIVRKEESKYSYGNGFNYINIFNNEILPHEEFNFYQEENLIDYLDQKKLYYTSDDLDSIYNFLISPEIKTRVLK